MTAINKTSKIRKTKKAEPAKVHTGVRIIYDTFTEVTRERDMEDEWDMDDTYESHQINFVVPEGKYPDLACPYQVEPGKEYFLVYITYSTGCTFNREDGKISFIGLYQTKEEAEHAEALIEAHNLIYRDFNEDALHMKKGVKPPAGWDEHNLHIPNNGVVQNYYIPWHGYFESFGSVETVKVSCGEPGISNEYKGYY